MREHRQRQGGQLNMKETYHCIDPSLKELPGVHELYERDARDSADERRRTFTDDNGNILSTVDGKDY